MSRPDTSHYSVLVRYSDKDVCYIATSGEFPFVSAFGDTRQEALAEFEIALSGVIDVCIKHKMPLPVPNKVHY